MTTDSHHPSDNMNTDNPEDKQRAFGVAPVPTPADSPADPSLDEITRIFTVIDNYGTGPEARAEMEQWKQRAVVAAREDEADIISKVQTRQGAKGIRHFAKDRRQMFKDRLSQLTVQPDKPHGASDVPQ